MEQTEKRRKTIKHYNIRGHGHFLTFSCFKQLPLLNQDRSRKWLTDALKTAKITHNFALWAYVIMPEHAHLLVYPLEQEYNLSLFLKSIKQSVSKKAKEYLKYNNREWLEKLTLKQGDKDIFRFWQAGPGYDRNINSKEELYEKIDYIHNNPVKSGIVSTPAEWPWSSAGWYENHKDVILQMDDMGLHI